MKDTKTEQLIWLLIGAFFTAAMIFFVRDRSVGAAIAMTFTGIVGVFLGIDIAVMIKKTQALPQGQYKCINKQRYIASLFIFALLLLEAVVLSALYGRNCDALYSSFGMGFLIVIGGLVAGVEGNKLVTNETQKAHSGDV